MPSRIAPSARLRAALDGLADAVESARFPLGSTAAPGRRSERDRAAATLRTYLIPRLGDPDAPLLVAVFGPTGSGKSTLVNSVAGRPISTTGPLRPTTRAAVVWCHRRHSETYRRGGLDDTGPVEVVDDDHPLLDRLTLVDTPDVDSHVEAHRRQTERILDRADAGIYVTTAQRYADAVPWEILAAANERRMPLVVVANRMSRRSTGAVADLASLFRDAGMTLRSDDIVVIQEQRLRDRLPQSAVRRVTQRLVEMAGDHAQVVEQTTAGALSAVLGGAAAVAGAVEAQRLEAEALWQAARVAYDQQREEIAAQLATGDLVRGEVVSRWQRLVGVGDLARIISRGAVRLRDLVAPRGPAAAEEVRRVEAEARAELVEMVLSRCRRAVTTIVSAWELEPGGRDLLDRSLRAAGTETRDRAELEVDTWLADLVRLVREQGRSRFRVARAASIGVNGAAALLLLGVFAATGGLTGAEVGVVAGAAAAQQTILEHVFGGAAARRLANRARADLERRLASVLESDAVRYRRALDHGTDPPVVAEEIRRAIGRVEIEAEAMSRGSA